MKKGSPTHLTAIITDRCTPPTITGIIGRDASPVNKLRPPKFEVSEKEPVKFGWLGEILDRLSK